MMTFFASCGNSTATGEVALPARAWGIESMGDDAGETSSNLRSSSGGADGASAPRMLQEARVWLNASLTAPPRRAVAAACFRARLAGNPRSAGRTARVPRRLPVTGRGQARAGGARRTSPLSALAAATTSRPRQRVRNGRPRARPRLICRDRRARGGAKSEVSVLGPTSRTSDWLAKSWYRCSGELHMPYECFRGTPGAAAQRLRRQVDALSDRRGPNVFDAEDVRLVIEALEEERDLSESWTPRFIRR